MTTCAAGLSWLADEFSADAGSKDPTVLDGNQPKETTGCD
jgi:hypothetical protein